MTKFKFKSSSVAEIYQNNLNTPLALKAINYANELANLQKSSFKENDQELFYDFYEDKKVKFIIPQTYQVLDSDQYINSEIITNGEYNLKPNKICIFNTGIEITETNTNPIIFTSQLLGLKGIFISGGSVLFTNTGEISIPLINLSGITQRILVNDTIALLHV